jgi:hypothetical protein
MGLTGLVVSMAWLRWQPRKPLLASTEPGLQGLAVSSLMQRLESADASWTPRKQVFADGRIRYTYKRRNGDPPLTLPQIRQLMVNPPRFTRERASITALLAVLDQAGVQVQLRPPRRSGATGEWDPNAGALRIRPRTVAAGSAAFATVLNHEAIHVAQSCRRGSLRAVPKLLGLGQQLPQPLKTILQQPVYQSAGSLERQLEREAYANQHRLELGVALVRRHCRLG